jgi:hypothetical protein
VGDAVNAAEWRPRFRDPMTYSFRHEAWTRLVAVYGEPVRPHLLDAAPLVPAIANAVILRRVPRRYRDEREAKLPAGATYMLTPDDRFILVVFDGQVPMAWELDLGDQAYLRALLDKAGSTAWAVRSSDGP